MSLRRAVFSLLYIGMIQACGGVYISPALNVPALEKPRQAHLTANARVFAPHAGLSAATAVAVSERARVGATVTGSFPKSTRTGVYGELFGGLEHVFNPWLQLGGLAGAGIGEARARHKACPPEEEREEEGFCTAPENIVDAVSARYSRYFAQAYLVSRAPSMVSSVVGVRGGVLLLDYSEVEGQPVDHRGRLGFIEPFLLGRVGRRRVQFEIQLRYVQLLGSSRYHGERLVWSEHFVYGLGLRFRLGPLEANAPP